MRRWQKTVYDCWIWVPWNASQMGMFWCQGFAQCRGTIQSQMRMEYLFQVRLTIMVNVGTLWYTIFNRKYIFNPGPISSQLCYFFRSVTNRNGKKGSLVVWGICLGGWNAIPSYAGIITNHNKDPYSTTRIQWKVRLGFFVAHLKTRIVSFCGFGLFSGVKMFVSGSVIHTIFGGACLKKKGT